MKKFFLVLFITLFSQSVWAGWVVTYQDSEMGEKSQEFFEGGKANFGEMIYTGSDFIVIDQGSKSYWRGTPQQYCEAMQAQFKMMETRMASMPAQYRPVPISERKVTRKKIGSQTIAGFSATGYEFTVDDEPYGEQIWVSSDSGLSGLIDFDKSVSKHMECFEGLNSAGIEAAVEYKQTVKGVVILKESYREVASVEEKSIAASHFEAPSEYKSFTDYQKFMAYIAR